MRWADAHREAMFAAADAHDTLNVEVTKRIDVFAILERLDLRVMVRPLRGVAGLYVPALGDRGGGVLVSSLHPLARQRFTAAHELGHHWLEHAPSIDLRTQILQRAELSRLTPDEMVAEAFASWFLMPAEAIDATLADLGVSQPRGPEDVYAVSLRLGTSYQATAYQMANMRLADYSTADRWAKQPPRAVKAALSAGSPLTSARRDVWALSDRDAGGAFQVRAGDRLVISLPEVPSSGYLWQIDDLPAETHVIADTMVDELEEQGELVADHPPPGSGHPRTLILDLDPDADGALALHLRHAPVWAPDETADEYTVHLEVEQPLLGRPIARAA